VAQDLFVEPAENVVIGVVTSRTGTGPCDIYLEGTQAVFSTDERMPFDNAINGSGFEVDPCTVAVGGSAAVEGYYGDADSKLHIFAFESDDADVLESGVTTITRASCDRGRIEVRGASTLVAGTAVVKEHIDTVLPENQTVFGTADLQFDAVTGTSIYRFRTNLVTSDCPDFVRVESDVDGIAPIAYDSFVVAPVDIK